MSDIRGSDPASTPTVELRVYRDGVLLLKELCDSEEDASEAAHRWSELPGVYCEVDDLSAEHRDVGAFEPELEPVEGLGDNHDNRAERP
jgi:hypothetical protein